MTCETHERVRPHGSPVPMEGDDPRTPLSVFVFVPPNDPSPSPHFLHPRHGGTTNKETT
jgi:hypothetical protein